VIMASVPPPCLLPGGCWSLGFCERAEMWEANEYRDTNKDWGQRDAEGLRYHARQLKRQKKDVNHFFLPKEGESKRV